MSNCAKPSVYSKRKGGDPVPADAIYVGRPTVFGNPFEVIKVATRDRHTAHTNAVNQYAYWLADLNRIPLVRRIQRELAGRDLVCWCQSPSDEDPLPCHATVLLEVANG